MITINVNWMSAPTYDQYIIDRTSFIHVEKHIQQFEFEILLQQNVHLCGCLFLSNDVTHKNTILLFHDGTTTNEPSPNNDKDNNNNHEKDNHHQWHVHDNNRWKFDYDNYHYYERYRYE